MAAPLPRVTRESLVDAALRIAEEEGVDQLSMRRLAAELGVAVTSIYWHVGNREALIEALVDRELADMGAIRPVGRTHEARLVSIACALRGKLLDRPHVIALVNERGLTPLMFLPAQAALARELTAAGLTPKAAATAVRAIQFHVIGSVVVERWSERSPEQVPADEALWHEHAVNAGVDPKVLGYLAKVQVPAETFAFATTALVRAVLAGA